MDDQPLKVPKHVAIIMDGNGRWAKNRKLSRTKGHIQGVETVKNLLDVCRDYRIPILTLWAFGKENWNRPSKEVRNLFRLFSLSLKKNILQLHEHNVCLKIIGDKTPFHPALKQSINKAEALTQHNTGLRLNIAINFSGKWDLTQAMQKIAVKVGKGDVTSSEITEETIQQHLSLNELPDPELLIRTSGEMRISNFLLWQVSYAELWVTERRWPEFRVDDLHEAIRSFSHRDRRFGGLKS